MAPKLRESKDESCYCGTLFPGAMLPPSQIMLVNILTGSSGAASHSLSRAGRTEHNGRINEVPVE